MKLAHFYFGDGVYAAFDGTHIILSANGPVNAVRSERLIFLEPEQLSLMMEWQTRGYRDYSSGKTFEETQA